MYRKNVASQYMGFQLNKTSDGTGLTGATVTVKRCIDGAGAYTTGGGTVTELANGGYVYAMSQADTNGNDITFQYSATGGITIEKTIVTTAADPTDAVHFGLTCLPNTAVTTNASLLTSGTGTDQISVASGRIDLGKALGTAVTLDSNNVLNVSAKYVGGTLLTARDIGLSVLLSSGTGTGQLDFTSGVVKGNMTQILGTAVSTPATAGILDINLKNIANAAVSATTAQLGVNVVNINAQTATAAAGVTFPATIASPTNITAGTITTVTNLTNAPTSGDFTATMKTSIGTAVAASAVASVTGNVGGNVGGNVTGSVGSISGITFPTHFASMAISVGGAVTVDGTSALTEAYAAQGSAFTLSQGLYAMHQMLYAHRVSGTTWTVLKRDNSTTAKTATLDSSTAPTSLIEAT